MIKNSVFEINLGDESDANYYHAYAIGSTDVAVNIWPEILRFFNNLGLYKREVFSYFFLSLNLFFIPILTTKISGLSFKYNQKLYLYLLLSAQLLNLHR